MRVVIADDSVLFLERLKTLLQTFEEIEIVGISENGRDVEDKIKTTKPDLAIIDIKMPEKNGIEVIKEIRKENKEVKFMVLTFYCSDQYRKLAIKSGSDYFYSKVDDFDEVQTKVNELIIKSNR